MADVDLRAVLQTHGITASPRELAEYLVEERAGQQVVTGTVPGVEAVFPALGCEPHPVAVWRWFTSPSSELRDEATPERPSSPRGWLLAGRDPKPVADLARDL